MHRFRVEKPAFKTPAFKSPVDDDDDDDKSLFALSTIFVPYAFQISVDFLTP